MNGSRIARVAAALFAGVSVSGVGHDGVGVRLEAVSDTSWYTYRTDFAHHINMQPPPDEWLTKGTPVTRVTYPDLTVSASAVDPATEMRYRYSSRDWLEVEQVLSGDDTLAPLLIEAEHPLQEIFGNAPVVLRVIRDPDSDDSEELFAYIQLPEVDEDAAGKLNRFDEEWWLPRRAGNALRLNFDLEYV